jgi:arsenite methyltransferase
VSPAKLLFAEGTGADTKSCCARAYESPAVNWLLEGRLHPGGEALTLHAAVLAGLTAGDRVLDVASGHGASALLLAGKLDCEVVGVDYSAASVATASEAASRAGLSSRVQFLTGDAESLPLEDASFDAVLCECSLCTFPDKYTAAGEMRRVLRTGGRVIVSDMTARAANLPASLRSFGAQVACVAEALDSDGYVRLLERARFEVVAQEERDNDLAAMVDRLEARLRLARMISTPEVEQLRPVLDEGIDLARAARAAIGCGDLGYSIFIGTVPA